MFYTTCYFWLRRDQLREGHNRDAHSCNLFLKSTPTQQVLHPQIQAASSHCTKAFTKSERPVFFFSYRSSDLSRSSNFPSGNKNCQDSFSFSFVGTCSKALTFLPDHLPFLSGNQNYCSSSVCSSTVKVFLLYLFFLVFYQPDQKALTLTRSSIFLPLKKTN